MSLGILESKEHVSSPKKTNIKRKCGFTSIFFDNSHQPISAISVQCWKNRCIAKQVDSFVHAWYKIGIWDRHYVHLAVVDSKAKSSVLFREQDNRLRDSVLAGSITFMVSIRLSPSFSNLSIRACTIQADWFDWLSVFPSSIRRCTALLEPRCPSQYSQTVWTCWQICCNMLSIPPTESESRPSQSSKLWLILLHFLDNSRTRQGEQAFYI